VIRRKPGTNFLDAQEAADQKTGADQQHHGKSQLRNDEQGAQAMPSDAQSSTIMAASSAGLERRVEIELDRAPHGREPKQNPSYE